MNQHIIAVGGSKGLGKAFASEAAALGYTVSVIARSQTRAGQFACDITKSADVARVMADIQRERGAISGLAFFQRFRGEGDAWQGELQTSLTGTKTVIEESLPLFAAEGSRAIVMVSSIAARFVAAEATCGYHVAKAGLCQMARFYANSLGSRSIRVNAVCPGSFIKPESEAHFQSHPEIVQRLAAASPLNRVGTYVDVVNAVLFLLSDKSSFITGQSLVVDGGVSLRWQENLP